tara:strand:- start:676 stop:1314 length:639 start_codon:yes stop_codon:yes gene_type:complete
MLSAITAAFALLPSPSIIGGSRVAIMPRSAVRLCDGDAWAAAVTTDSGLKYIDELVGSGDAIEKGTKIRVDYTGRLAKDGTVFDSSKGRGPFTFPLGEGRVIPGWDEGVASMKIGGKRKLLIPADLAYGDAGAGDDIPPNSVLEFDVEVLDVAPLVDLSWTKRLVSGPNAIIAPLLFLSFVPYLIPDGALPPEIEQLWKFKDVVSGDSFPSN